MFSEGNSFLDLGSMDILEYIDLNSDDNINSNQSPLVFNGNYRSRTLVHKMKIKSIISVIRVILIIFFYLIDGNALSLFLTKLIGLLLVHETCVIGNFCFLIMKNFTNRMISGNNMTQPPRVCFMLDIINNFIFFFWFVYGNILILADKKDVEDSLISNFLF